MEWRTAFLSFLLLAASASGANGGLALTGHKTFTAGALFDQLRSEGLEPDQAAGWGAADFAAAATALEAFYQAGGYALAEASCVLSPEGVPGCAIREGPRARLQQFEIDDGSGFPTSELERLLPIGQWYSPAALEEGLLRLESHYHDHGYPDARARLLDVDVVELDVEPLLPLPFRRTSETVVRARIEVETGPFFVFGTTRLPAEAASLPAPETLAPYSRSEVLALRERLARHYHERGEVLKHLEVLEPRGAGTGRIDLEARVATYPPLIIDRIAFDGNTRYPDEFYRRELSIEETRILDPRELEKSLHRLAATGTLEGISGRDIELKVDPVHFEVAITFTLRERKSQTFAYSIGSDPLGGLGLTLFYTVANLLGLSETLGLEVSVGDQTSTIAATIASRYLLGTSVPLGMALRFFTRRTGFRLEGLDDQLRRLLGSRAEGVSTQLAYRISEREQIGLEAGASRFFTGDTRRQHYVLAPFWRREGPEPGDHYRIDQRWSVFSGPSPSWNLQHVLSARRRVAAPAGGLLSVGLRASHATFFGAPPVAERVFFKPFELRGFTGATSGPWGRIDGRIVPVGGDTLLAVSGDYVRPLAPGWDFVPFADAGFSGALSDVLPIAEATRRVVRASLGAELRARPIPSLPQARFLFSFNPLRFDELLGEGLGRLTDPQFSFRVALEP